MGGEMTSSEAVVQNADHAYRLLGERFKQKSHRHGEMQVLMLRYTQALITQMTQTAVCNRHHSIEQQLCRWLLMCLDRLPSNRLTMTQELMANMLGVPREGIRCDKAVRNIAIEGIERPESVSGYGPLKASFILQMTPRPGTTNAS